MKQPYFITEGDFQLLLEKLHAIEATVTSNEKAILASRWLDNEQLMVLLKVSKRTLQNWRDCGYIAFSQIGHKIYYQYSEVEAMLQSRKNPSFR